MCTEKASMKMNHDKSFSRDFLEELWGGGLLLNDMGLFRRSVISCCLDSPQTDVHSSGV